MLQKQSPKTGAGAATEGMEDKETLEASAVISETADSVEYDIDLLFPDCVVTTCVCECCKGRDTLGTRMHSQLLAASSFPVIIVSGWKSSRYLPVRTSSITLGSRSM